MQLTPFEIFVPVPAEWPHPALASAAAKAGATGLIDSTFCNSLPALQSHLERLLRAVSKDASIGIRLRADQTDWLPTLEPLFEKRSSTVIVVSAALQDLPSLDGFSSANRRWLAELPSPPKSYSDQFLEVWDGLVLSGSESAGFAGLQSSLVNAQSISESPVPIYCRGGIGIQSAAACLVAGAAGVFLEEAAWLLPESSLDERTKIALGALSGEETRSLGSKRPLRAYTHPTFGSTAGLEELLSKEETGDIEPAALEQKIRSKWISWGPLQSSLWPVGQAIGLASDYADRFSNISHLIQDLLAAIRELPGSAASETPLAANAGFASSLGLNAGIVQGPMTRVSDVPAFASSISSAGAMPTLALALLNKESSLALLKETSERLGDQPWGVGILGFVPPELQEDQIAAILECRPSFAVIAGGRPDQAERLEDEGIATFLHVPTPALLKIFLKQGARRFIFEGRECGGHVGPLSSFVLWSRMVDTLLEYAEDPSSIQILFAGGIHNSLSAAMATTIAAPLLSKGMSWGILIGTPYLFTREAVDDGAITETFQEQAIQCSETVCLPVAPGHANRCMPSQFSDDFLALRRTMIREEASPDQIRAELEAFTLGRLRVATKGVERNESGELIKLSPEDQFYRGMFMVGESVTLRNERTDVQTLHRELSEGSQQLLSSFQRHSSPETTEAEPPVDIAIVGVSTFLPDAADKDALWKNLLDRHVAVREIPKSRWDTRLHYDHDRDAPGKTNSKWGGFFPDVPIDLAKLGIPPSSAQHMSTSNLLCLEAARLALADAGYESRPFDRENTAVILANADGGGHLGHALIVRSLLGLFDPDTDPEVFERMPPIKEESLPGTLTNVVAGRISNRMDLGGPNFTVDAACASSLATIDLAARELNSKRSNVVLAGASEIVMGPPAYVAFSKVGALSGTGTVKPFDQSADGIALSDGIVFLVLKRLSDAERDGDRIYSVIKGVGGSSDGKALGMTAPRPLGQKRALRRAYANAGYSPSTIGFYEAHATGTPVGDTAELETIIESLQSEGAGPDSCVISSSKGVLGHSRTSAGMAALVKSILALHYKVLPPLSSVSKPLPGLDDPTTPVNVRRTPHPWIHTGPDPRRAGVSAFGFGGTNFHVALEEYTRDPIERSPGGSRWPAEVVLVHGRDDAELKTTAERWLSAIAADPSIPLADIAFTTSLGNCAQGFAAVVSSKDDLLNCLREIASKGSAADHRHLVRRKSRADSSGKIAFLFPGQASQNIDMAGEATLYLKPLRDILEDADRISASYETGPISRYIYPPTAFSPERLRDQRNRLAQTEIAQPAIGAISIGLLNLMEQLGITPDRTAGHSYGEIPALVAAGRLASEDALEQSFARGQAMSKCPSGSMAAIHSSPEEISPLLEGFPDVVIANHNAPRQVVVAGPVEPLEALVEKLNTEGIRASLLPVSGAFHSPLMSSAVNSWEPLLAAIPFKAGSIPTFSAVTQDYYPEEESEARKLLLSQLTRSVSFVSTINQFYEEGVRTFVEVGPRNILSNLTAQILKGREHRCVVLDDEGKGLAGLLGSIAGLWAEGRSVDFSKLFAGRSVQRVDLDSLAGLPAYQLSPTTWLVNSSFVRKTAEEDGRYGSLPLLTVEDREKAREKAAQKVRAQEQTQPNSPSMGSSQNNTQPAPIPAQAYAAYQETMREFLRLQESVMRQFGSGIMPAQGTSAHVPPPFEPPPLASPQPTPARVEPPSAPVESSPIAEPVSTPAPTEKPLADWSEEELLVLITGIVSDKTGYPPEMLGPDLDMEADLGIDSIKRIEILDVIQERFSVAGDARALVRALGKKKTLREIAYSTLHFSDETEASAQSDNPPADSSSASTPLEVAPPKPSGTPSPVFVMERRDTPLSSPLPLPIGGVFLVTEDRLGVAAKLLPALERSGVSGVLLSRSALASESDRIQTINDARDSYGPIRGIVHLAPLCQPPQSDDWDQEIQESILSFYSLLRLCSDDLQQTGHRSLGRILSASLLGGNFGRTTSAQPGTILGGANVGLVKTLDLEWPDVLSKAVDFADSLDPEIISNHCLNELLFSTNQNEVGYDERGRSIFVPAKHELPAPETELPFGSDDVIVATGGARGITAKCLQPILGPETRLIILGRTERHAASIAAFQGCRDLPEIRNRILSDESLRPDNASPAAIESLARQILNRQEIEQNLADLGSTGATIEYRAVDITESEKLRQTLRSIKTQYGQIDHFIHGAGILADNLIENKPEADFLKVVRTKISCLPVIAEELTALKSLVLFASVSGRFGNYGQIDYAAANEVLNRFAWQYRHQYPATKVLSLNWGPWAEGGMADPSVIRKLRERGIEPIEPECGTACLQRLLSENSPETEYIVGTGPWAEEEISWEGAFDAGLFLLESNASFRV